jgi:hypothetical protein
MTPLAYRITKQLTLPAKVRTFNDNAGLLTRMDDVHCFEISEVVPLIDELAKHIRRGNIDDRTSFLPAPKTWVEHRLDGMSLAFLLEETSDKSVVAVSSAMSDKPDHFGSASNGRLILGASQQPHWRDEIAGALSAELLLATLAVINTPRIINRTTHNPNRWLERRLLSMRGVIGKFPLHAWTEIKLQITAPTDSDGEDREAHYTGDRALHFCRSHLRVRYGRVEIVRSHWRGDASLGIKQSRYKLEDGT